MNSGSAIRNTNRILLLVSFGISLILGGLYIGGDQTVYIKVYETIGSFVIVEAFLSGFAIDVNSKSKIKAHFLNFLEYFYTTEDSVFGVCRKNGFI